MQMSNVIWHNPIHEGGDKSSSSLYSAAESIHACIQNSTAAEWNQSDLIAEVRGDISAG